MWTEPFLLVGLIQGTSSISSAFMTVKGKRLHISQTVKLI